MATLRGWDQHLMISGFQKESAFDAGKTHTDGTSFSLTGFEVDIVRDDKVVTDKDEVTGKEHGNNQELVAYGNKLTIKIPKCKPNDLAALATLVMGADYVSTDPGKVAYRHRITPVTEGTALPSIAIDHIIGAIQTQYKGVKGNTLKLSGEQGGFLALEAGLLGSGTRATGTDAFAAAITESWMKISGMKVWIAYSSYISVEEILTIDVAPTPADWAAAAILTGASSGVTCTVVSKTSSTVYVIKNRSGNFTDGEIISDGTNSRDCAATYPRLSSQQDAEDISTGTPNAPSARMKSFEFAWDNKAEGQTGFGGAGVFQDIHYGRRAGTLKLAMLFNSTTEILYFTSQDVCAVELDLKGAGPIAAGGTYYYGAQLQIPRCKLKAYPKPEGGVSDSLSQTLDFEIFDDGVNKPAILDVYTGQITYLAAP